MEVDEEIYMAEKLADVTIEENDSKVSGSGLFAFQTPKSSKTMLMKAFDSASKTTPKSRSKNRTPKAGTPTHSKQRSAPSASTTKGSGRKGVSETKDATPSKQSVRTKGDTPRRLKARNKSEETSSSEESCEEDEEAVISTFKENCKNASHFKKLRSAVDEYFLLHAEAAGKGGGARGPRTSNRTLARLGSSRPDALEVQRLLRDFYASKPPNCYLEEREELFKDYENQFPKWTVYLQEGFNILLYGLGSKINLLQSYCDEELSGQDYLVIRGYVPNVTIRNVLRKLCEQFVDSRFANKQIPEQLEAIRELFNDDKSDDLFLIVHNIDGPLFRNEKARSVFCQLAGCKKIHFLASVDHINAPLLWSSHQLGQFAWLWHDCTTFEPYTEETAFENSLLIQQGGQLILSSLRHVMASLTQNAREIFLIIARHQLEAAGDKSSGPYEGFALEELYWRSRDACLVNNDVTLRAQLTEFKDHKLIRFKKAIDGTELVIIPLDDNSLTDFVTNINDYVR